MSNFRYWMFRPETLTYELRVRFPDQKEDDVSQVILKLYREDALALVEYIKKGAGVIDWDIPVYPSGSWVSSVKDDNLMEPLRDTGANFIKDGESIKSLTVSEENIKKEEDNVMMPGGGTVLGNLDKAESALEMINNHVNKLLEQCEIIIDERHLSYVEGGHSLAIMVANIGKWLEDIEKKLKLVLEKLGA